MKIVPLSEAANLKPMKSPGAKGEGRKAKGEGSIVRRKDGTWQFSIRVSKTERLYLYGKTRAELLRKKTDLEAQGGGSIRPRARGTVGEWVTAWLERPNLSKNTRALYESMWRVHVAPSLASVRLQKLDREHVVALYASLRRAGCSDTIIHRVGVTMQSAIQDATKQEKFNRANPFAIVPRPTPRPKEQHALAVDEARRILDAARKDRLEALFVVLMTGGLRIGEALGLKWSDIDFERRRLSVNRSLIEVGGKVELRNGQTKTRGSRRPIDLGSRAIEALRRRKDAAEAEGHGSALVFSTMTGTPLRRSNVRHRHFEPILERAGIDVQGTTLTMHGLRHAMTSFGIASGVAPKILAERLGHSTVRLTEDRYAHVLPGLQREAADAIDALLE